jgi:hypothetical protein
VHAVFIAYLERRFYIRDERRWLVAALRNASQAYLRSRGRGSPQDIEQKVEDEMEWLLRRLTLAAVLARIGSKCRQLLRMHYLRDHADAIDRQRHSEADYVRHLVTTCRLRVSELFFEISRRKLSASDLRAPETWQHVDAFLADSSGIEDIVRTHTRMKEEERRAETMLNPLFASPLRFRNTDLQNDPRFHTEGAVRVLCSRAHHLHEERPQFSLIVATKAFNVALKLTLTRIIHTG